MAIFFFARSPAIALPASIFSTRLAVSTVWFFLVAAHVLKLAALFSRICHAATMIPFVIWFHVRSSVNTITLGDNTVCVAFLLLSALHSVQTISSVCVCVWFLFTICESAVRRKMWICVQDIRMLLPLSAFPSSGWRCHGRACANGVQIYFIPSLCHLFAFTHLRYDPVHAWWMLYEAAFLARAPFYSDFSLAFSFIVISRDYSVTVCVCRRAEFLPADGSSGDGRNGRAELASATTERDMKIDECLSQIKFQT